MVKSQSERTGTCRSLIVGTRVLLTLCNYGTDKPYSLWLYSTNTLKGGYASMKLTPWSNWRQVADPVLKLHNGVWYLFVFDDGLDKERVFFSNTL